jgi:Tfp pilus assembly protein PilN
MGAVTAVFLGDRTLSVVAGKPAARGVELTHAASATLPEGFAGFDGDARSAALRTALEAVGAGGRRCVLVVPRPLAILRTFTLPSGTPEELQSMIRFQLEKELPIPLEQVRTAYVTHVEDDKVSVTAAAVPNDALNPRIAALESAGMQVTSAVVSSFGLIRLLPPGKSDGGSLLLALADGGAEILIAESGRIEISRNTLLKNPQSESWAAEIDRAILAHQAKAAGSDLQRVYVAGEGDPAERVAEDLKVRMPGAEVKALIPNGIVTRRPDVRITSECAATAGVVVGMLAPGSTLPDLLRAPVIRRALKFRRSQKIGAAAVLAVVALLAASQIALSGRRSEIESMQSKIASLKGKTESVDRMTAEIQVLQQWQDRRFSWVDLFDQLQRRLPAGRVLLSSFTSDETGGVRLSGKAKDNGTALEVAAELQKMGPALLKIDSPQIRQNNDKEYRHDFDIKVTLADLVPAKKAPKAPAPVKK